MGLRGPPPKPSAIRQLEGDAGHKGLPKFEPQPTKLRSAEPPSRFSQRAKNYWYRLCPMLARLGLLTEADLIVLERYCDFLDEYEKCIEFLDKAGDICYPIKETVEVTDPISGQTKKIERVKYLQPFPHVARKMRVSEHLLKIEQHFGMTPASRTRIMVEAKGEVGVSASVSTGEVDPFDIN